jgi:antitoxin HicB
MATKDYAVFVKPLSEAEGGGYVATVPDLPGCMSDGETMAEAAANVTDAIEAWIAAAQEMGRPVPKPGDGRSEFRQRLPRTLHAQLTELARLEGVSLNTLITSLLAESVGRREAVGFPTPKQPIPNCAAE